MRFHFWNLDASVGEFLRFAENWRFHLMEPLYIRALVLKYGGNIRAYINSSSAPGRHNQLRNGTSGTISTYGSVEKWNLKMSYVNT